MNKLILCLCFFASLYGEVIELHTWKEVEAKLETLTPEDLAVFDVDQTLITSKEPLLRPPGYHFITKFLEEKKLLGDRETYNYYASIVDLRFDLVVVLDPQIPATLNKLKDRSIKCIALTAQPTGEHGLIPKLEEWRHKQLQHVGIDFSKGPFSSIHYFAHLGSDTTSYPVFHDGILCSCDVNKEVVLLAFLDRINFKPHRVIFIDDKKKWVENMSKALDDRSISNLCIHFRLTDAFDTAIDPEIAAKQLEYFLKEKKWFLASDLPLESEVADLVHSDP